jgi:3-oxoacyl-(acyl-carrier-protein) synthase
MSIAIRGVGCATPLGSDLQETWSRLMAGERAATESITGEGSCGVHQVFRAQARGDFSRHPRLRRASPISQLCAAAGMAALEDAGVPREGIGSRKIGVVFAVTSGGVIYTRKFHRAIATEGAAAASPLLFPETVYNAPASHLAALLGIEHLTYTLVGDGSVGLSAIHFAAQLIATGDADECLVVAGEEVDWITCEGYREWRLITKEPAVSVFQSPPRGTLLAESAAAVLLGRSSGVQVATHPGVPFTRRKDCRDAIARVVTDLTCDNPPDLIVTGANGTYIDRAEAEAISRCDGHPIIYNHKAAMGESLGAGAILQTVLAATAIKRGEVPPVPDQSKSTLDLPAAPLTGLEIKRALVTSVGFNEQAAGLLLSAE